MMENTQQQSKPLGRYFTYQEFEDQFLPIVQSLPQDTYTFSYLGSSVQNRSIYGLQIGHGKLKILAWSQMHGNESTSTRALLDLLQSTDLDQIIKGVSLYIIPVLNPDGLEDWTRVNANGVDLNRDALELSQPESLILKDALDFFEPDLALNLHGQRTFYGLNNSVLPAQLSFLTPSGDSNKQVTDSRLQSMSLINAVVEQLSSSMGAGIGRYDDGYNPNCWGDHCQSLGIPTVLFEAGHSGDDYSRDQVKGFYLESLKIVISTAKRNMTWSDDTETKYFNIPEIHKSYCDILIRNLSSSCKSVDLAVMYHEQLIEGQLCFIPMIFAINEPSILYGHRTIDLTSHKTYNDDLVISEDMEVSSDSLKIRSFIK
ncbi:M14 family zinc carboxypeptidase [Nonlabens marinus]|uniref:Peptidase M14 domain-containing protein n=1 Tax=Nonlabens marinus S1-08 TaxID=1454201 RepID=W8VSD6_9FLAO|nr:M14 family zinc carboxypeptidase [Nonlabens marinus]BAO56155.1 hypothetical protein NMS_2146 [Nonlabens marinus S1-08]